LWPGPIRTQINHFAIEPGRRGLGFAVSSRDSPPPRLSLSLSLSPLGFTRSRLSGSLAVAVLPRRRHLSRPVVTTPRPRTSSICFSVDLLRSRLSGSLAVAVLPRRRHLSRPVVTTPRLRTSSICFSVDLLRSRLSGSSASLSATRG
jgi:methyl coenzyme M reductase subunit C